MELEPLEVAGNIVAAPNGVKAVNEPLRD